MPTHPTLSQRNKSARTARTRIIALDAERHQNIFTKEASTNVWSVSTEATIRRCQRVVAANLHMQSVCEVLEPPLKDDESRVFAELTVRIHHFSGRHPQVYHGHLGPDGEGRGEGAAKFQRWLEEGVTSTSEERVEEDNALEERLANALLQAEQAELRMIGKTSIAQVPTTRMIVEMQKGDKPLKAPTRPWLLELSGLLEVLLGLLGGRGLLVEGASGGGSFCG